LPEKLSDLGIFHEEAGTRSLHPTAHLYEPRYPLWSNGSDKERLVSLPEGQRIDTSQDPWRFPVGTVFVKTFAFSGAEHPVETRVSVIRGSGAQFFAYEWDADGKDATLLDGRRIVRVSAEFEGAQFEHEIPSTLQCRTCHESARSPVLGFDALRLTLGLDGEEGTQLESLSALGLFEGEPDGSGAPGPDEYNDPTLAALEYFEGNCVHCHNGSSGPSSAFDLRSPVALENLIGVETTSELLRGLRVDPGSPKTSAVYQALLADLSVPDTQAMPPLGVQHQDARGIALIADWISSLE
jgi:hypothetical protein